LPRVPKPTFELQDVTTDPFGPSPLASLVTASRDQNAGTSRFISWHWSTAGTGNFTSDAERCYRQ
jgi:hypothetical protein